MLPAQYPASRHHLDLILYSLGLPSSTHCQLSDLLFQYPACSGLASLQYLDENASNIPLRRGEFERVKAVSHP
jgi:hypothetical protein